MDTDLNGDGLAYEDGNACRVIKVCDVSNIDPDGDGFGREGDNFCEVGVN